MAYLTERQREADYNEALRRINPTMNSIVGTQAMGAINQVWPSASGASMSKSSYPYDQAVQSFTVEKVDNGYIIRSGKYSKICKDMTELSEQFIAIMVEAQLDK